MTEDAQKPYSFSSYNKRDGRSYNSASEIHISIIVNGKSFPIGSCDIHTVERRKYAKRLVLAFFCIPLADYFTYKCNLWCVADPGKVLRCPAITPINPECEQTFKTILIFAVGLNITQQFYESTITNASQRASYFDSILFSCLEPSFNNLTPSAALVMAKATFRLHCF